MKKMTPIGKFEMSVNGQEQEQQNYRLDINDDRVRDADPGNRPARKYQNKRQQDTSASGTIQINGMAAMSVVK